MKKEEFIKILKEKLDILEESEIEDIIEEYSGYIEEKIKSGMKEEDAIKDFGDIDELSTELLKAYKINVSKNQKEKNWITSIADQFILWMDKVIKVFSIKSGKEIIKIIIELFCILIFINLCKIPFHILENLGYNVFHIFQNEIGNTLFKIWEFIMEFAYLIFGVVLFIKIFEKRYIDSEIEEIVEKEKKTAPKMSKKEQMKAEIVREKEEKKDF